MTEQAFFSSAAQRDCFKELDVEEYEIVATLDSHTSEICREMDGKHFPMSEWAVGVTAPPFHVLCRSTKVPYFDDDFGVPGERAARGADGKTYYVPADMKYKDWKKSFVGGGDKSELKIVEPNVKIRSKELTSGKSSHPIRTKELLEAVTNTIKKDIQKYSSNPSKWSGTINAKDSLPDNAAGTKEWTCDISVLKDVDDGVLWHEMLHSCSASYYDGYIFSEHETIEEASVEFLKQQICLMKNISNTEGYQDTVGILKLLNDSFQFGSDLEFAQKLFNVPLPDRYQWLEDLVSDSLKKENASFEDYNEVMLYVRNLKGGTNGIK